MSYYGFKPYVPVAKRRAQAAKKIVAMQKKGRVITPVVIEGRKIAKSFWGKAWCDNLERYSDYANRLPRGRTYVGNGSVVDLQVNRGRVEALVSGSELYQVKIDIAVAAPARWKAICADCAGSVGSLVELLQGKLSKNVMERVCREADGLFPAPREIRMSCSCPDGAVMCKHVAAALYGVGARLDSDPDVLFLLRGVNRAELVSDVADLPLTRTAARSEKVLADDDFAALFGLELDAPVASAAKAESGAARRATSPEAPADVKPQAAKIRRPSRVSPPPPVIAIVAPTPAHKKRVRDALTKPAPESAPAAVIVSKRRAHRGAAASAPSAAKERRSEAKPAGRTRAAKWIGARKAKADR